MSKNVSFRIALRIHQKLIHQFISPIRPPHCSLEASQGVDLLFQCISLPLDCLDVVDCTRQNHGFAGSGLANYPGLVALTQNRDCPAEALEFRVEALAVLALDLVVGLASGTLALERGRRGNGGWLAVVGILAVEFRTTPLPGWSFGSRGFRG